MAARGRFKTFLDARVTHQSTRDTGKVIDSCLFSQRQIYVRESPLQTEYLRKGNLEGEDARHYLPERRDTHAEGQAGTVREET